MLRGTLIVLLSGALLGCDRLSNTRGRFLYEVSCEANVTRFDTVEKKKTTEYELPKQPSPSSERGYCHRIEQSDEPRIAGFYFRGMAPTGVALYRLPNRFELVDLGVKFPADRVTLPTGPEYPLPATFFADR